MIIAPGAKIRAGAPACLGFSGPPLGIALALRGAFVDHLAVTKEQVSRLETIFDELGARPGRKRCAAMEGLVQEGQELIQEDPAAAVLDAGLIAAAQRVEHYEIAAYGT